MVLHLMIRNGQADIWEKVKDNGRFLLRLGLGIILIFCVAYLAFSVYKNQTTIYVSVLGDSFSSYKDVCPKDYRYYYDGKRSGVSKVDEMWWSVLCKQIDAEPLMVEALSGCTVTEGIRVESLIAASNSKRCNNLDKGLLQPDIIIVAVGVNDYSCGVPLLDFSSSYSKMLSQIRKNYPKAKLVCISPWYTQRGNWDGEVYLNELGFTVNEYSQIVECISKEQDCLFFDTNLIGFNRDNYYPQYCIDSEECPTHPNAEGQRAIGELIAEWYKK